MMRHSPKVTTDGRKAEKMPPTTRAKQNAALVSLSALVVACTTLPDEQTPFRQNHPELTKASGFRAKILASPPPEPAIERGAALVIDPISLSAQDATAAGITADQAAILKLALGRHVCTALSDQFDIVAADGAAQAASAYRLKAAISEVIPTGRVGAAIGNATAMVSPLTGVRPPVGLGALTVQFELYDASGRATAAMLWRQKADVISSEASVSPIGDAYALTESAGTAFADLLSQPSKGSKAVKSLKPALLPKPDPACEGFGGSRARDALGLLPIPPLPPEVTERKRKPKP